MAKERVYKEEDYFLKKRPTEAFEPVISDIRSWPIFRLGRLREKVIETVSDETMKILEEDFKSPSDLRDLVAEIYYQERIRMKEIPWKADPKDEGDFWKKIKNRLRENTDPNLDSDVAEEQNQKLLKEILDRYSREIAGDFKLSTFNFARNATAFLFMRLFNAASEGWLRGWFSPKKQLLEKIQLKGELEHVRSLTKHGTILLVPTHFSNLDSIIVGWALDALGLPAFTYGAGINLFGHPVLSYFMSKLGAFTVDRRKKNKAYLNTLKRYTQEIIERGCHTLFFPGGTRSRNGSIEKKLKLGLLGTALEAQRKVVKEDSDNYRKIFVCPVVINYHFVLEAANLIDQHLKRTGKGKTVMLQDDFGSIMKNAKFIWKFLSSRSEMMLSFGKPMDLFGNDVDMEGRSFDKHGRKLNIADYYISKGEIIQDLQRDNEYTRILGDAILDRYFCSNIVFSSHLVAFTAFQYLQKRHRELDIYELLTLPPEELNIPIAVFERHIERIMTRLHDLRAKGKVQLADHLDAPISDIIDHGIKNINVYHTEAPVKKNKEGSITSQNLKTLYFYHNRLDGYGLDKV